MTREQGFTLIELMVVLAVVAVLCSGGAWSFGHWQQRQRLWHSAQSLRQFLLYQRQRALAANLSLEIAAANGPQGARVEAGTADAEARGNAGVGEVLRFAKPDIQISDITPRLGFYGERATAWPGHITLSNPSGRWRAVVSSWGRVRLCRPEERLCR